MYFSHSGFPVPCARSLKQGYACIDRVGNCGGNNGKAGKRKKIMAVVTLRKMLENGVHFGHQTRKWNPNMKQYIYTAKNGVYIIDLNKTQEQLQKAYDALKKLTEDGGKVLFVGTKKQAQATILEEAIRSGSFYVNQRWLGGTLTNFRTIQKSIKTLVDIEEMESNGTLEVYTKKEQALLLKKKEKLDNFLGGIKEMKKLPDAMFVVDPLEEHNAVAEARKLNIPVFALIDTNADPSTVDYPIPANDDALRSIKLMVSLVADAICEGKNLPIENVADEADNGEDITMKDVIKKVEEDAAEFERRRRQRYEERRAQMAQRRGYNGERRVFRRDANGNRVNSRNNNGAANRNAAPKSQEAK
jgi:small subunit ribosomal protein S2